jgi:hypothetical protein
MKKGVFIFLLLFCNLIYSQNFNTSDYFAEQFFDDFDIQYDYVVINLEGNNSNNLIAHLAIFRGEGAILSYGTSGFILNVNNLSFQNNSVFLDFIKIWIGAEEPSPGSERYIEKYKLKLPLDFLKNPDLPPTNTMFLVENYEYSPNRFTIRNIQPTFYAKDSNDSASRFFSNFFVKTVTHIKTDMSECSESIGILTPENRFEILDINCLELDKDDLWIQIKFNDTVGYIPFISLGENWTIIDNNFEIQKTNDK